MRPEPKTLPSVIGLIFYIFAALFLLKPPHWVKTFKPPDITETGLVKGSPPTRLCDESSAEARATRFKVSDAGLLRNDLTPYPLCRPTWSARGL